MEALLKIALEASSSEICSRVAHSMKHVAANGTILSLCLITYEELQQPLFEWAFKLVKTNLYDLYVAAQDTGWSDERKRKEMMEARGRYLVAMETVESPEDGTSTIRPVGFLFFVFTSEDSNDEEDEVLGQVAAVYCMELQLEPSYHKQGLGAKMLEFMEKAGQEFGMRKSMLTVFKQNEGAMRFYKRYGYTIDSISPSVAIGGKRGARYSYEILSKVLVESKGN